MIKVVVVAVGALILVVERARVQYSLGLLQTILA